VSAAGVSLAPKPRQSSAITCASFGERVDDELERRGDVIQPCSMTIVGRFGASELRIAPFE
jgi:hypothetical protein